MSILGVSRCGYYEYLERKEGKRTLEKETLLSEFDVSTKRLQDQCAENLVQKQS